MGRMNPVEAQDWRTAGEREVERRRVQTRTASEMADLMDRAWRWVDSRPALAADSAVACRAVNAILWRRFPSGLGAPDRRDDLERWLLGEDVSA